MKGRDVRTYLHDIKQACDALRRFAQGRTLTDYLSDEMFRSAVERKFEIVGEALRRVITLEPTFAERITDHRRIIDFRNRLIHGYAVIDDEVVWGILESRLQQLEEEIDQLLIEGEDHPG